MKARLTLIIFFALFISVVTYWQKKGLAKLIDGLSAVKDMPFDDGDQW